MIVTQRKLPQAVILAAGRGNRLLPLTADRPKGLLEVGGQPILIHQIEALERAGVTRIQIICGHGAALVEDLCRPLDGGRISFAHNIDFDTTTSLWSLGCTTFEPGDEGLMILNSDVLFDPALIEDLLEDPREQVLLSGFGGPLGEEEMKIRVGEGNRILAISKTMDPDLAQAENLGVLKVGGAAARRMLEFGRDPNGHRRGLCWVPDAIQQLLGEFPFFALSTGERSWIEIDYAHDLARARDEVWPRMAESAARTGSPVSPRHP